MLPGQPLWQCKGTDSGAMPGCSQISALEQMAVGLCNGIPQLERASSRCVRH